MGALEALGEGHVVCGSVAQNQQSTIKSRTKSQFYCKGIGIIFIPTAAAESQQAGWNPEDELQSVNDGINKKRHPYKQETKQWNQRQKSKSGRNKR